MRQAIDFIKDEVIEGNFINKGKLEKLGVQPDGSVYFKKNKNDLIVYHGYMFKKGYAVGVLKGAR